MKNQVEVVILDSKYGGLKKPIGQIASLVFEHLKKKNISVEIYVMGHRDMKRVNRDFRGKDRATNVLSFVSVPKALFVEPQEKIGKKVRDIGEVYICPSFISKVGEDLKLMVIHGLLHLLGYDHEKRSDRIKMQNLEKRLCQRISLSV